MNVLLPVSLLLGIAAATTVSSTDKHGENLVEWLRSKGGTYNSKLEIRRNDISDPTSRFGMFANAKILQDDILLEIPQECLLIGSGSGPGLLEVGDEVSADHEELGEYYDGTIVKVNEDGTFDIDYDDGDEEEGVKKEYIKKSGENNMCGAVRNLIDELKLGDDSKYGAFVNYLLDQSHGQLPAAWSKAGQDIFTELQEDQNMSDLPPTDPMDNWWIDDCNGDKDPFQENAAMIVTQRGWDDVLIPIFDMMSHRNGDWLNTYHNPVRDGSSKIVVQASRDIQAGEEVYNSYNFCSDCGGRSYGYGTPEILRDYGFVEQYPQRWFFLNNDVAFELDEQKNADGSGTGELKVTWIVKDPSDEGIRYCKHHLERLEKLAETKFKLIGEGIPKNEWETLKGYNEALIIAMNHAIDAVNSDGEDDANHCIFNESGQCMAPDAIFDSLKYEWEDVDYHSTYCTTDGTMNFEDYNEIEVIQSAYQKNTLFQNPDNKDTCFDLDNTVQICGSYRPHYHEMVVHLTARYFEKVKRVMFVGGGDSMLLHETVKYPSLELVVGLEIDQKVTRASYKHFGTQPHWDNEKVEWWFGDAAKSLLMLPKDYFGSFDMVLVDLSETIMSITVTDGLDIFGALALLLKPDGIIIKNEVYLEQMSALFPYTAQVHYYDVPIICTQAMIMASNNVDFINRVPIKHNIDNLFLKPLDDSKSRFENWHDYRKNTTIVQQNCKEEHAPVKELVHQQTSPGILMIVEAEDATGNLSSSKKLKDAIAKALEKQGLTVMDTVVNEESGGNRVELMIILREGYVVARTWPDQKYCAFDINLWSSFEKHAGMRTALIGAVGSNRGKSSSSYRIVVGGMFGVETWKDDEKNRGPRLDEKSCDTPVDTLRNERMEGSTVASVVQESISMVKENDITVAVICGLETELCDSLEAVSKSANVGKVVPVWTCPNIKDVGEQSLENNVGRMLACKRKVMQTLKEATTEGKKVRGIVVDSSAPFTMGQIIAKIFEVQWNLDSLLNKEDTIVIAPMVNQDDAWRRNLVDRFRKDFFVDEPTFRAEVLFNSSDSSMEMSFTSSGNTFFFDHLVEFTLSVEKRTNLIPDIRYVEGGKWKMDGYDESLRHFVLPDEYDQRSPHEQWKSQQPMGRQTVFQLEIVPEKQKDSEAVLSSDKVKSALEGALLRVKLEPRMTGAEVHEFTNVGDGSVMIVFWEGGNIMINWDGRFHVDINIFTASEDFKTHTEFQENFMAQLPLMNLALLDEQPRGYGRVVNFSNDIEPRVDAHWAYGLKD